MTLVLRIAELLVCLLLVAWTVVFPLATLLSLALSLPLFLLFGQRLMPAAAERARHNHSHR